MSKAVPSDGKVNKLFEQMAARGLKKYGRKDVDEVLVEEKLKQCKYETLVSLQHAYIMAFGDKNWSVHAHIIIKAEQSSTWRAWRDKNQGGGAAVTTAAVGSDNSDPLAELKDT